MPKGYVRGVIPPDVQNFTLVFPLNVDPPSIFTLGGGSKIKFSKNLDKTQRYQDKNQGKIF
jgi:hypothetical protein